MRVSLIIIFSIFASSCDNVSYQNNETKNWPPSNTKSAFWVSQLNMPNLEGGTDSFELRVWNTSGFIAPNNVTILRYSESRWHLTNTTFWMGHTENYNGIWTYQLDSAKTINLHYPENLELLIDSIQKFDMENFPTQEKIPGFVDRTADGSTITVEYAKKHSYNVISYKNPHWYEDAYHKKFLEFLRMLNKNLDIQSPYF